jgi:hypothetical protein
MSSSALTLATRVAILVVPTSIAEMIFFAIFTSFFAENTA